MRNIVTFPSKASFSDSKSEERNADDVVRSMALVTQQLEMMLDALRERARQEGTVIAAAQEKTAS